MTVCPVCGAAQAAPSIPLANVPGSHLAAAAGLVAFDVVNSVAYKNRAIRASIEAVDPDLLRFAQSFLRDLTRRGWPFFANEYWRDRERQNQLNHQGNSKAKFGQSAHNYGMAVDIVHYGRFWELTRKEWELLGMLGKEAARRTNVKIVWGGDFKSLWDPAHWELADWRERVKAIG